MTGTTAPDPDAPTGAETSPGSPAGAPGTPGSSPAEAAPPRPSSLSRPLSSSAVFGTGDLAQTPMHYGEPRANRRALAERGAIVDLPHVRVAPHRGGPVDVAELDHDAEDRHPGPRRLDGDSRP